MASRGPGRPFIGSARPFVGHDFSRATCRAGGLLLLAGREPQSCLEPSAIPLISLEVVHQGGNNSVVECDLAKVEVAGSNPVSRSNLRSRSNAKVVHRSGVAAKVDPIGDRERATIPRLSTPFSIGAVAKW